MKMNDFLKSIASDIKTNNREFKAEDFYLLLKYVGVKKNSGLVNDIEKFYEDFLASLNNSLVKYDARKQKNGENVTHHIAFYADKKANYLNAVKVYFPVKYEYMISALKTVFVYLIRNNIMASVKFHVKGTNEGIVIRFYDQNDCLPFINYCNNNFVLKDLLESVNPFIATIHGLGIVRDDNTVNSYNGALSEILKEYFINKKTTNTLDSVCDLDFLDFISKKIITLSDEASTYNLKAIEKNMKAILNKTNPLDEKNLL